MKVLHIGEYVSGGVATYITEVVNYQTSNCGNNSIGLAISNFKSNIFKENENIDLKFYKYDYKRNILYFSKAIKQISEIIKDFNPDIIHLHSTFAGLLVRIYYFFKKDRPKIIYCAHGWSFIMDGSNRKKSLYACIEKILSIKTDKIINISKNEMNEAIKFGLPQKKMELIYNGISETKVDCNIQLGLDPNKINLLFVGRFDRAKGIDLLLNIFNNYEFSNINLYLIGSSTLNDLEIKIPSNVEHLGWVSNENIDSYYKQFDAVIIPSRWEGFGLVAIEAMKNRKAVISSNQAALAELVEDGYNGLVININDEENVIKVLSSLNKEELKVLGVNGESVFLNRYTSIKMNNSIIEAYNDLLLNKG